jgi:hypothetical protein
MKVNLFLILTLLFTIVRQISAQDKLLLKEKPGTFKIKYGLLNGQGPDQYTKSCGYSKAESDAAAKNLEALVDIFRRLPVLREIKGFDGIAYLNGGRCNTKFGYGLPSSVKFYFKTWSLRKGKEVQWINEPPEWQFEVNMTEKFCSNGFNVSNYSSTYNPTNPAFNELATNKSTVALRELFFLPGVKEAICPGIDRYGENLIIFNPDRPDYWNQVTIREVFRLLMDYWKQVPDKIQEETIIPILKNEFSAFSETEKNGFAYFGSQESVSRIGSKKYETPVMRPNPEYWSRSLPITTVQYMSWQYRPESELELEKFKPRNGGLEDYVGMFFNSLPVEKMGVLIDKK